MWDNPSYFISAYGIAVKHGFIGTEKQWLLSLKGDPGQDLLIVDTFATYDELIERYPGTVGIPEGFMVVGTTEDFLLYYWDPEDLRWYSINIIGPAGADGKSAYELAVQGGYTGTQAEFDADLGLFKTYAATAEEKANAASASEAAARSAATSAQQSNAAAYASAVQAEAAEERTKAAAEEAAASRTGAAASEASALAAAADAWKAAEEAESIADAEFATDEEIDELFGIYPPPEDIEWATREDVDALFPESTA